MILVKFPSRERPDAFKKVLGEWVRMAEEPDDIHYLFTFDKNDRAMMGIGTHIEGLGINATVCTGMSRSKVDAINRDIDKVKYWDILLVISDDMHPVRQGWDTAIRKAFAEHFPDGDGVVWFYDGKQRDICTLPLMDRAYYDRTKYVYNPIYKSVFCDDEQTHIAKDLGKLVFIEEPIAHHHHPANFSHIRPDALYRRNETPNIWARDERIYFERRSKGFP